MTGEQIVWLVAGIGVWVVVGSLIGFGVAKAIRQRDRQVPAPPPDPTPTAPEESPEPASTEETGRERPGE